MESASLILPMNHQQTAALLRVLVSGALTPQELWYLIKPSRRTCREIVRESRLEGDPSTLMATSTLLITCSMGRDFQMSLTARLNLMTFVRNMASYAQCELNMFLLERDAPIIEKTYMFVDGGREESQWLLM